MKRSRHLWLLLVLLGRFFSVQATPALPVGPPTTVKHIKLPTFTNAEYYFDHDPGVGLGHTITIPSGDSIINVTANISLLGSGLQPGIHYLYIRVKNFKNDTVVWSIPQGREFLIPSATTLTQSNIVKAEYYFDHDPGVGSGIALPSFNAATNVNVLVDKIPTASLSSGIHYLFIRAKNANGMWSIVLARELLIPSATTLTQSNIVKAEYYFDHDPGVGNGTALPSFTAAHTVNVLVDKIPTASLSSGIHYLFIRAKNANGMWSIILARELLIPNAATLTQSNIVKAEYFIDTDPGVGNGTALPSFTGAHTVNITDKIHLPALSAGIHYLFIRAQNDAGSEWSIVLSRAFLIPATTTATKIVKAEYFIDTDPGVGNGTAVSPSFISHATVDTTRKLAIPNSLSLGVHNLYMRAKNNIGQWGIVLRDTFHVETAVVATATVTANVLCHGSSNGNASASFSGGTSPYTYSWSNGTSTVSTTNPSGSVLSAGTYTVTVTDLFGNSGTARVTITQPTSVGISITSVTNVSCNTQGSATAHAASGGVSPYTYFWSSSGGTNLTATGLSGGTYIITATDNHGCTATTSATITQSSSTIGISISSVTNVSCFGSTGNIIAHAATGGISPYTYSWSGGGGTNLSTIARSAGTYTITATDNLGCSTTASATITQPASALGTSVYFVFEVNCHEGTGSIEANTATGGTSPYTYSWSGGGGTNISTVALSAGTYTLTVRDNHGCSATVSATLTQPATSVGVIISSVTNISCYGGTGSLTATATGGTSPYNYSWGDEDDEGGQTLSGVSAGTYTVSVTDNNGCSATAIGTVTQPASPLGITITSVTNVSCNGGGSITAHAATGGTSPYTYSWSPSGGTNLVATGISAGTYTITATDNHGCIATASATITQPASSLGITISSVINISCFGGTGSATANAATGGTSPYTYSWSPGGGTNLTKSALSAGTYTITVTDNHGCTALNTATITQPASALGIIISSVTNISCHGGTGAITAHAASGGTSPYTYSWSSSGGTNVTSSALSAGTYTLTVHDNHGCSTTVSATITQPAGALTITLSSLTNVGCRGGTGNVTAHIASGGTSPYTYLWSPSGGTNLTTTALSAGTYTITATDANGCSATVSATITQPASALGITITSVVNVSCNIQGSITAHAATGGTSPYTYSWSAAGGTNLTATGLSAGTYTITVKDTHGCTAIASATISQPASSLGITISSVTNISCHGGTGSITAHAATGGNSPYTYSWSGSGGTNLTSTALSAGTYTISVTDSHGCVATVSAIITQPASPLVITISSVTNVSCNSGTGNITAHAATGGTSPYTYVWSPSGGSNLTTTALSAGSYTITATDSHGCTATVSAVITQPTSPLGITISSVTNVSCNGGTGSITASAAIGGTSPYTYSWSPGGGSNLATSILSAGAYTITATDAHGCTEIVSGIITQPTVLGISISAVTNISCHGGTGSATANAATGGTSPYSYSWSPAGNTNLTATNLSAGTYTITATDSQGCTATTSIAITQPATVLGISMSSHVNVNCNGSSTASASANAAIGGTLPYTYSWSASGGTNLTASGLSAGTYTITTTDNHGCTAAADVTITQPTALGISINTQTNVSCNGGTNGRAIAHSAAGGVSPYTYSWSPSGGTSLTATGLSAGTYTITAMDSHGCTATVDVTITQPPILAVTIITPTNINCFGERDSITANLPAGGTSPYTYHWSPSGGSNLTATNLGAGTYTITVTDNHGCTVTSFATITQPAAMVIRTDSMNETTTSCNGSASVTVLSGGTSPYSYSWATGQTTATITGQCEGSYCCTVTDNHGCSQSVCITIKNTTGIENISNSSLINIYPNPNKGQFTVEGIERGMYIEVYDCLGRKLSAISATDETMQVNISTEANGVYFVRIIAKDGTFVTDRKMVKIQ